MSKLDTLERSVVYYNFVRVMQRDMKLLQLNVQIDYNS